MQFYISYITIVKGRQMYYKTTQPDDSLLLIFLHTDQHLHSHVYDFQIVDVISHLLYMHAKQQPV